MNNISKAIDDNPSLLENVFVVFSLCMFTGFLVRDITIFVSVTYYTIYAISIFLVLRNYKRVLKFAFRDCYLWAIPITACLSTFWSVAPELTLRRSITLLAVTVFGIYLGICYNPSKLSQLLRWALAFMAVLSLALLVVAPSYAYWDDPNAHILRLRGPLAHPNHLGRLMVLSATLWLIYILNHRNIYHQLLGICMICCSITSLLLTKSAGSLIAFALLLTTLYCLQLMNWLGKIAIFFLLLLFPFGCVVVYWLVNNYGLLLDAVGRDETLSGRTLLWEAVWRMIEEKPWLGYGFDAFWTGWDGPAAEVWVAVGWKPPYSHNGFLDLLLSLGLLGLILLLLSVLRNTFEIIKNVTNNNRIEATIPSIFIAFTIFTNLSEGHLVTASYFWVLYVFASTNFTLNAMIIQQQRQNSKYLKTKTVEANKKIAKKLEKN